MALSQPGVFISNENDLQFVDVHSRRLGLELEAVAITSQERLEKVATSRKTGGFMTSRERDWVAVATN